jgi:glycosyltransferase involved in cell wall biosynthesis
VRILYLTDRLSLRGGADQHLLQVIASAAASGHRITVACGNVEGGIRLPEGIELRRVRGLAAKVESGSRLGGLAALLDANDLVHIQNLMNPAALRPAVGTGRAVVTIQDHRMFCPGMGKSMPDGSRCEAAMADGPCSVCLPDGDYRERTLELTRSRRDALRGARLVVLSKYMADELELVGLPGAEVIPPWVELGERRDAAGSYLMLGGRLVPHKGVLDGWRAWRASASSLELRVAGEGPLGEGLEGAELLGWLAVSDLRRELRGARALLFPARWQEPFGILGLQALAEGTPVIVAESGGTTEWSDIGCARVAPGDVDGMADAIKWLDDAPGEALRLGRAGQLMVGERFARPALQARLDAVYQQAAG